MRIRFDGKTVVVSGVGHGFGRCIAETFAQLGARVFGCDLSAPELAETAKAEVETEVLDLTDRAAAAAWIAQIEQTTRGAVDVLVNNAGGRRRLLCQCHGGARLDLRIRPRCAAGAQLIARSKSPT